MGIQIILSIYFFIQNIDYGYSLERLAEAVVYSYPMF